MWIMKSQFINFKKVCGQITVEITFSRFWKKCLVQGEANIIDLIMLKLLSTLKETTRQETIIPIVKT